MGWNDVCWVLQALAGPGHWAIRPYRWRWVWLGFALKAGAESNIDNWRFLFVRSQMGLLQEGVLAQRLRPEVWKTLHPCQSGYQPGVGDARLVLNELVASYLSAGRCLFIIMGDFKKAFRRTWRKDLLEIIGKRFNIQLELFTCLAACWSMILSW